MAKATESASLSVEPQRTKTRSWLRLPQPCLIAWLPNCRRRIPIERPRRAPIGAARTVPTVDLLVANEGWVTVPCQDRSRRRRRPKASLYKGRSAGHARHRGRRSSTHRTRSLSNNSLEHASLKGGQKTPRTPGITDNQRR